MPITQSPIYITFRDISELIPIAEKTLYNKATRNELPFPTVLVMSKRAVKKTDFDAYLASLSPVQIPPVVAQTTPKKRGRGRPSNQERAARTEAAK